MRGRYPTGPEYVDKLEGTELAKKRAKAILETLNGTLRLQEACHRLGVCEQRFHQVRQDALQAAVTALEPGLPGRPAQQPSPDEELIRALRAEVAALQVELRAAKARQEIALTLPHLLQAPAPSESDQKKKTPGPATQDLAAPAEPAAWTEEQHVKRLAELCQPVTLFSPPPARRGFAERGFCQRGLGGQRSQRQREHDLRTHVVDFQQWTEQQGLSLPQTAETLHLATRTLRQWCHDLRASSLNLHALGRPPVRPDRHERNAVLELLKLGPTTSVATLQACFPDFARAELTELLRRYRRVCQQRYAPLVHVLRWTTPGTVWAMDFAESPLPIDGLYPYLLGVRDLASGQQLLWLPLSCADAAHTLPALHSLFLSHGAPLVLKSDNGSAFCAGDTLEFLHGAGVIPLFSPPQTPEYNGSIEASIGSLKTRTETYATDHGRPNAWTWDDAAAAQQQANATSRPRGPNGPCAEELWQARTPLTPEQRARFADSVNQQRADLRAHGGWPLVGPLTARAERALDRQAIRRALVEHDFLLFRRRRISLSLSRLKTADIR